MTLKKKSSSPTVFLHTLGCSKNDVDSQRFAGVFLRGGAELVDSPEKAEWGFVNTCGFIVPAIEESLQAIFDLEELKVRGVLKAIGVIGCLYSRFGEELRKELPEVDFWIPCEGWEELRALLATETGDQGLPRRVRPASQFPWVRSLKIVEGCNNHCSYCTIPSIRGPLRSLPPEHLLEEARILVEEGAREICVIGQDITRYGEDLSSGINLTGLLRELGGTLPEDIWLRLLYLHPLGIHENFWKELLRIPQVIPYADVPIQHGSEAVLKRMNRKDSRKRLESLFEVARSISPSMVFRTTVMVGFPGEDEEAFEELLDLLRRVRFQRLGCFIYSPEEGTPGASCSDQVDPSVARERMERVMALQEEISLQHQETLVGTDLDVVVEQREGNILLGRSYREAPDVDGCIEIDLPENPVPFGSRVRVRIVEALEHDLRGEILYDV